jgi:glucan phosphoethanolaminetransferase (alkaline phosphatase superfamily)
MRSPLHLRQFFILFTYALLSVAPFLPFLFGRTLPHPMHILALEIAVWSIVWSVFKHPAWFHWLLLPAFLTLPIEVYLQIYYQQGISTHHLGIIAETSPKEALEFLGNRVWLLLAIMLAVTSWWGLSWKVAFNTRCLAMKNAWRAIVLAILVLVLCVWLYGREYGVQTPISSSLSSKTSDGAESAQRVPVGQKLPASRLPKLPSWARIPIDADSFGSTWPFGLAVQAQAFWKERQYLAELARKSKQFKFGANQASENDLPQVVVMVIGESSRYDRWSLNGYQRETNPLLKKEPNLISLSNVVTAVSATRLSVPVLVSRKPATQSLQAGFSEKSFLTAFKEAGFKTYWLSNQMSFGQFDTPISVFANEADVTQFLNLGGFTNSSSFDSVLLDPLKTAISDPTPKKLIVLHTLGNHWNYSHRYPKEFDKWQPSLFGIDHPAYTDTALKPQLNNSYDNSILYTDWFLSQVIGALKSTKRIASMMYVADHGQTLYDGTCNLAFHGHNTQFEFHIPALVWYSDLYRAAHPAKVALLQKNRHARLTTENVFHSLLDMADIRYDTEQLEWSFLNQKFKLHKRYVDSYGWSDYDNSTFKGDCREVIDKGKPLPRSERY